MIMHSWLTFNFGSPIPYASGDKIVNIDKITAYGKSSTNHRMWVWINDIKQADYASASGGITNYLAESSGVANSITLHFWTELSGTSSGDSVGAIMEWSWSAGALYLFGQQMKSLELI